MKKLIIFICLCIIFISCFEVVARPKGKLTAKIVDESGSPIEGVKVLLSFSGAKKGDGGGITNFSKRGTSDDKGLFLGSAETLPLVGVVADKEGYYRSIQKYEFTTRSKLSNRWEPWNPTIEVVMKKKRNSVAMYDNHRTSYKIPNFDTQIGFDLEKEDWVAPYGKGLVGDFLITFNSEIRAYTDYDCGFTLAFSNPYDGIQEYFFDENEQSYFKWPFEAPEVGYLAEISKQKNMLLETGYTSNEKENVNYIFRIRSKVDSAGNIVEAKYGKLKGEFGFVPKGKITFRYILNSDGTHNLEEDPEKNLFKKK